LLSNAILAPIAHYWRYWHIDLVCTTGSGQPRNCCGVSASCLARKRRLSLMSRWFYLWQLSWKLLYRSNSGGESGYCHSWVWVWVFRL